MTFLRRYVRTNEGTKEAINRLLELFNTIETYRRIIILRTNEVLNKCTRLLDAEKSHFHSRSTRPSEHLTGLIMNSVELPKEELERMVFFEEARKLAESDHDKDPADAQVCTKPL